MTSFLYLQHICTVRYTVPLYIDALVGSQKVEAVEDSVAENLDIIHWKRRGKEKITFAVYISGTSVLIAMEKRNSCFFASE